MSSFFVKKSMKNNKNENHHKNLKNTTKVISSHSSFVKNLHQTPLKLKNINVVNANKYQYIFSLELFILLIINLFYFIF